jgi:hypothetical protein
VEKVALRLDRVMRPHFGNQFGYGAAWVVVATRIGRPPAIGLVDAADDELTHRKTPWPDRLASRGVRLARPSG